MKARLFPLAAVTLALLCADAFAMKVTKNTTTIPNQQRFGVEVTGTNLSFYGAEAKVMSISFQEYVIYSKEYPNGSIIVCEVVLDMENSNQQLRIYSARPPGSEDVADRGNRALAANAQNRGLDPTSASKLPIPGPLGALESKLTNIHNSTTAGVVVKTYPNTTHSKTVEMVVSSKAELLAFYTAVKKLYVGLPTTVTDSTAPAGSANASIQISKLGGCLFILE